MHATPTHDEFSARSWFQWVPWVCIAVSIVECFAPFNFSPTTMNLVRFLFAIVLLDVTHNAFGFSLLLHPRISSVIFAKARGSENFRGFVIQSIALIVACTVFFAMAYGALAASTNSLAFTTGTALLIKSMFSAHHSIFQAQGFSLLLNKWLGTPAHNSTLNAKLEKRERFFAHMTNFVAQVSVVCLYAQYFGSDFHRGPMFYAFVVLAAIAVAGWIHTAFSYSGIKAKKTMFVSRMLLTPLAFFSNTAKMSHSAVHGLEYLYIYRKMLKNGGESVKTKRFIYVSALLIAAVALMGTLRLTGFMTILDANWSTPIAHRLRPNYAWVCWLAGFSEALTIWHYFMDRRLFRFREPAVREVMNELLALPQRSASVITLPAHADVAIARSAGG